MADERTYNNKLVKKARALRDKVVQYNKECRDALNAVVEGACLCLGLCLGVWLVYYPLRISTRVECVWYDTRCRSVPRNCLCSDVFAKYSHHSLLEINIKPKIFSKIFSCNVLMQYAQNAALSIDIFEHMSVNSRPIINTQQCVHSPTKVHTQRSFPVHWKLWYQYSLTEHTFLTVSPRIVSLRKAYNSGTKAKKFYEVVDCNII